MGLNRHQKHWDNTGGQCHTKRMLRGPLWFAQADALSKKRKALKR